MRIAACARSWPALPWRAFEMDSRRCPPLLGLALPSTKLHWRNIMLRRGFLALGGTGLALGAQHGLRVADSCGCAMAPPPAVADAFDGLHSGITITGMKVFGVSLTPESDRPYVFVKLETNQGVVGWGDASVRAR